MPDHLQKAKHSKLVLFEKLEALLGQNGFGPTGFTKDRLPTALWMLEVILRLDPDDRLGAFSKNK